MVEIGNITDDIDEKHKDNFEKLKDKILIFNDVSLLV